MSESNVCMRIVHERTGIVNMRNLTNNVLTPLGDQRGTDMRETQQFGVELGRWVRQRREALGMTAEQVWTRMEMPSGESNWIAQIENGRRKKLPDFDYLNGLAVALRVPVTEVLRGAGVLPIDVEEAPEHAPGSATMHALIDMIDWTRDTSSRENVEGLLRLILDRQRANAGSAVTPAPDRA